MSAMPLVEGHLRIIKNDGTSLRLGIPLNLEILCRPKHKGSNFTELFLTIFRH